MSIRRVLTEELPRKGNPVLLDEHEAHHAVKVMRLGDGAILQALDGNGGVAWTSLMVRGKKVFLELIAEEDLPPNFPRPAPVSPEVIPAVLEQVILKGEAMEWVIEKAVELGFRAVQPLWSDHCVVQMRHKGAEDFRERWQKIADQALKQCGRTRRLQVWLPQKLEESLAGRSSEKVLRYWADEAGSAGGPHHVPTSLLAGLMSKRSEATNWEYRLLIGPEGGFSAQEREYLLRSLGPDFQRISLGPRVLRAETAAIYGMSLIQGYLGLSNS